MISLRGVIRQCITKTQTLSNIPASPPSNSPHFFVEFRSFQALRLEVFELNASSKYSQNTPYFESKAYLEHDVHVGYSRVVKKVLVTFSN